VGVGIGGDEPEASRQASFDLLARLRSGAPARPVRFDRGPLAAVLHRLVPTGAPTFHWLGEPGLPAVPVACSWDGAVAVAASARPEEAAWIAFLDAAAAAARGRWAAARTRWAGEPRRVVDPVTLVAGEPADEVPVGPGTREAMAAWESAEPLELRRRTWAPDVLSASGRIAVAAFARVRVHAG
jgi:hypothetical protein